MNKMLGLILLLCSGQAFSQGGDKPGPHGGNIEMPGAFHTEVVAEKDGSFRVYLIDVDFENPTVKDSKVVAWVGDGKTSSNLKCVVKGDKYFLCTRAGKSLKATILVVKANREQIQGNEATYKLPLKW